MQAPQPTSDRDCASRGASWLQAWARLGVIGCSSFFPTRTSASVARRGADHCDRWGPWTQRIAKLPLHGHCRAATCTPRWVQQPPRCPAGGIRYQRQAALPAGLDSSAEQLRAQLAGVSWKTRVCAAGSRTRGGPQLEPVRGSHSPLPPPACPVAAGVAPSQPARVWWLPEKELPRTGSADWQRRRADR